MEKTSPQRVLARRLATELTEEALWQVAGQGTSIYGTGCRDALGRSSDAESRDCVDGADVYYPAETPCP